MPNLISPNEIDTESFLDDYLLNILIFNQAADIALIEVDEDCIVFEATDANFRYIKLSNNNGENLSIVRLQKKTIAETDYYLINKSYSFIQQKGYGSILYEYCFCYLDFPVISDNYQTKAGSSNLWLNLHKKSNKNYEIFIYNENTGKKIRLSKSRSPYSIWGVAPEMIEIYKNSANHYNNEFAEYISEDVEYYDIEDPFTNVGNDYIHQQLIMFIKDGLQKKVDEKRIKQKVIDRGYLRLIGSKI